MKKIILLIIVVIIGYFIYQVYSTPTELIDDPSDQINQCNLSEPADLRKTDNYDIFGQSVFDTVVCGYNQVVSVPRPFCEKDCDEIDISYFVIEEFSDAFIIP